MNIRLIVSRDLELYCHVLVTRVVMPVGRVYQAPATTGATVARNVPVFGYNGLKSVSNTDLVITGKAVAKKKSKSK